MPKDKAAPILLATAARERSPRGIATNPRDRSSCTNIGPLARASAVLAMPPAPLSTRTERRSRLDRSPRVSFERADFPGKSLNASLSCTRNRVERIGRCRAERFELRGLVILNRESGNVSRGWQLLICRQFFVRLASCQVRPAFVELRKRGPDDRNNYCE